MNKFTDIFITNEANKIPINSQEHTNVFLPFYVNVSNDGLSHIFSYFQYKFNDLFNFLNYKMSTNSHYNADSSRDLLFLIDWEESLYDELINSKFAFYIDDNYLEVIKKCKTFLSGSGGSGIPEDFAKINLIKSKPIFYMDSIITVNHAQMNLKLIGEGSYAQVFKYKDPFYKKFFAKKRAKSDLIPKELERFRFEYQTMAKLNSPYVLEVYNFDEKENSYIMECADLTLYGYIQDNNTKLTNIQRKYIVNQIFKVFEYIHQVGLLHRDISTTNILIKKYDNELLVIKVSDFGLVKNKDSLLTSDNTDFKGSLNDPKLDIVGGFKNYTTHHETYALCRLIYFVMTGKTIIDTKFKNIHFEAFVNKGISDAVNLRYQNVHEIKQAFDLIFWD